MVTSGLAGAFPTLQIGIFPHHMFPELVLPLGQLFLVSHDLLGTEPAIRSQRDKRKVHMGRFLVHMHHSRYDCFGGLVLLEKGQRLLKIGSDLRFFLSLKELRCGSYQGFHDSNTI